MSLCIDIARDVTAEIAAASLSLPVVVSMVYSPLFDNAAPPNVAVYVVPRGEEIENAARDRVATNYMVDVAVHRKVGNDDSDIEELVILSNEISRLFLRSEYRGCHCVSMKKNPLYVPSYIGDLRQFLSVTTVTFRGYEVVS